MAHADRCRGRGREYSGLTQGSFVGQDNDIAADDGRLSPCQFQRISPRSTGEIIKDQDVLATWSITEPVKS